MTSCTALLGPYAINQLLAYLESGGEGATIKPWVWIMAFFSGPMIGTILQEFNFALVARMIVRMENIITLLVFERALKMRFTEDVEPDGAAASAEVVANVSDEGNIDGEGSSQLEGIADTDPTLRDHSEESTEGSQKESMVETTPSDASSSFSPNQGPRKQDKETKKSTKYTKNLVGRLTNLVSTDLTNFTQAQGFIFSLALAPLQLCLSISFLYSVLGWSAFVGLATMIIYLPIPGWFGKLQHAVQKEQTLEFRQYQREEVAEGRIVWDAFIFYFRGFGGPQLWILFFGLMAMDQLALNYYVWFLGYWARQCEDHPASDVDARWYLAGDMAIFLLSLMLMSFSFVIYLLGSLRASGITHERLTSSILHAPLRWLDSIPSGRIIARFAQDINTTDNVISQTFSALLGKTLSLVFKFGAVLLYSPIFLIPGTLVASGGALTGNIFMAAQLPAKREMSNARSPIYSHFNASLAGLISIRAYGVEDSFKKESRARIDRYTRPTRALYDQNRWVNLRIDALGSMPGAGLATYLVYGQRQSASIVGFSLSMALSFTCRLLSWVRMTNYFELEGNSMERIKAYVEIDQEARPIESGKPPAYWPATGSGLNFEIKPGERVGVVGGTGAGKSPLSLAFLRMIPTTGKVLIDGVDTASINLNALRSSVTIIPQQPELMSGTLRKNLDPFREHDDAMLNSCLQSSGLFSLQEGEKENKIGLDTSISSGGANFSVGQRQIIAMARAMTDIALQEAVANEFNDSTLIIIVHRLQTIMTADKILVLDAGKVIEFQVPRCFWPTVARSKRW
ncbi:hypothetical protein FRB96_003340 [Tulasnella sp. 330]|nr:hypothetical protein FRB96_003340 [Tulasnella sp. 330]